MNYVKYKLYILHTKNANIKTPRLTYLLPLNVASSCRLFRISYPIDHCVSCIHILFNINKH